MANRKTSAATSAQAAAQTGFRKGVEPYQPVCVCVNLRRVSRTISQIYDDTLAPSGLKITQFSLLRAIERLQSASVGALAEDQELDRTTLTRNLAVLARVGLIAQTPGRDKRVSLMHLTTAGRSAMRRALPLWQETQREIRKHLGTDAIEQLRELQIRAQTLGWQRSM